MVRSVVTSGNDPVRLRDREGQGKSSADLESVVCHAHSNSRGNIDHAIGISEGRTNVPEANTGRNLVTIGHFGIPSI
jgi:hypothetical protein